MLLQVAKMCSQYSYNQTSIWEIPEEWEAVELDDLIEVETGKRAKGGGLSEGTIPSIGGEHIDRSGNVIWNDNLKFIPEDFYDGLTQGKVGLNDVLIVKDGATTGKVALVNKLPYPKVAVNEHVFIIRSKSSKLLNEFLFYVMFSSIGQRQIKLNFHGMIGGIKRGELKSFKIPLPPLPEQKSIAFVLSTIQTAKEKTEQVIKATKELKKSMMKHLFTYGPVSLEEAEKVKLKETEVGMIPKEWEVVRLGDVAKISSGGSAPQGRKYFNGDKPFIRVKHIDNESFTIKGFDLINNEAVKKYKLKLFPKGTIVFPKSGASVYLEKRALLPLDSFIVSHLCAVNVNNNVLQEFVFYFLIDKKLAERKAEGYPTLNLSEVKQVKIPLPPLPTQQKIASILSVIDEKIQAEENKKKALEDLFKSMLHNLMTGRIRVKDLNFGVENV